MMFGFFLLFSAYLSASTVAEKDYLTFPPLIDKPRILVVGDSISIGYTPYLEEKLKQYQVIHSPGNALNSGYGATNIKNWVNYSEKWELCILNHGLHDIVEDKKVSYDNYQSNIAYEFKILATKCRRSMFITSTMVQPKSPGRSNADVIAYNSKIQSFLMRGRVKTCDLYQRSAEIPELYKNADQKNDVHFIPKGYESLADYILGCIRLNFPKI